MFASFVPTRQRSASSANAPGSAEHFFSKKQKLQHQEHEKGLNPTFDNGAWETLPTAQPYGPAPGNTLLADMALADEPQTGCPASGDVMPFPDNLLDIPDDLDIDRMSFCSSDTDFEDLGEDYTSNPRDEQLDIYGESASLLGMPDDKKGVDMGVLSWLEAGFPSYPNAEGFRLPAALDNTLCEYQLPASATHEAIVPGTPAATPGFTSEQFSALKKFADTTNLDVVIEPDGIKLKRSPQATPDSFLTQAPPGFGVDTGLSEREFTEGPLRMEAESAGSHVDPMIPTQLFPETSTGALDFSALPLESPPPFDCPPVADYSCDITDDELLAILFGSDREGAVEIPKAATEEVTDSEFLPICNEADSLSEDGTFQINGRPVTRMSSAEFARTRPYDLQVVSEELSKEPPHPETSLNWCFIIPNRSPKDLNKFLPEKTWTNGGKNKEKPTELNNAMTVQHIGFQAHKLPRAEVPGYLQLDATDRAMLRFSMKVYTRRGVRSCKKAYPTAYVVLTLKKPIRRLRHARRG
ncbi:hypothetical protein KFL_005410020 [Klebsormidium nitens]|uniref:Uncharacterized protein n=1 Tax=Klebsormidium nitens TaxID=105231 RepID=A0A1Y1IHP3_KLENI|nr:hypothetical protein KFL_005410020 [Klebsormidium nitens]|eukprot:GAQ89602.1 hypothetical protein KFL_005410020 [Klebsormidium nitens]